MTKKLNYKEVMEYIGGDDGNGCKLISKEYINTNAPLKIMCKCGKEFSTSFSKFKSRNKKQCNDCIKAKGLLRIVKPHDKFIEEVYELFGNEYTVLGEYKNAKTKIKIRHNSLTCENHEFYMTPNEILQRRGCPKCKGLRISKAKIWSNDKFKKLLFNLVGNEYTPLEKYKGANEKIKIQHNSEKCNNYQYYISPSSFFNNECRCPKCYGNAKKTTEEFKEEVFNLVGGEYKVLGVYKNNRTKLLIRHNCDECDSFEFKMTPSDFIQGARCPKCNGHTKRTQEQFENKVYELVKDEYSVMGNYINSQTKIRMRHNNEKCVNYEWDTLPDNFLNGRRCPKCNKPSKGETKVDLFLTQNNIQFTRQYLFGDCRNILPLPFDFAIFENEERMKIKCIIEYDGEQHFRPVRFNGISNERAIIGYDKTIKNDVIKNDYCLKNSIKLIRIPYWEFDNIENILTKELDSVSGVNTYKTILLKGIYG